MRSVWLTRQRGSAPENKFVSLSDQLTLGVRALELDVHWVLGELRIAHCGGLHVAALDSLVNDLNEALEALGLGELKWDTETVGCNPSLSAIPAKDQRTALSALQEVVAWLRAPNNTDTFVTLFLDDQGDLVKWDKVPQLEQLFADGVVFDAGELLTPDAAAKEWPELAQGAALPAIGDILARGYRALVYSATDLQMSAGTPIWQESDFFSHCPGYSEGFSLASFLPAKCTYGAADNPTHLDDGSFRRVLLPELQYGPLDGDFRLLPINGTPPALNAIVAAELAACGVNEPSPDKLTPQRASGFVWTWADGETPGECALASAQDARWRAAPCEGATVAMPAACRSAEGGRWVLGAKAATSASVAGAACPAGSDWAVPLSAREAADLGVAAARGDVPGAWINLAAVWSERKDLAHTLSVKQGASVAAV